MARLLDDLLDVSRVTLGKIELKMDTVDFGDIFDHSIDVLSSDLVDAGLTLRIQRWHEPLPIYGDAARLQQVVVNLLRNAIKYTPAGGSIDASLMRRRSHLELRVRDTGVGIEPEMIDSVFDMFVQGERTLQRSQGGIGLGLTLVRAVTELHGGSVEAYSEGTDTGSEFRVEMPLTERPADAKIESGRRRDIKKIVVVEDLDDAATMLRSLLEMQGYQVIVVADGIEGLKVITAERPDLSLIDIGLPGMDGYELVRRLRADSELGDSYLVALTGYGQTTDRDKVRDAGFDAHLVKPLNMDELHAVLHEPTS